ncbi:MAG: DUF4911 domain-containing protein [Nitrospinae bacterium]|jgi:hypothetical protein|nr:DUF4911 domain-containing protein [Nitrospinota bacterium]MDA1109472.1 DUF4911 domain-containing protein [Nitrospinota bacterium]
MTHTDSIQWLLEVNKEDIAYIVSIFDAYEDFAVVRTLDQSKGLIELMISPDFIEETQDLLDSLAKEIPVKRV